MSKPFNKSAAIAALMDGEAIPVEWMDQLALVTEIDLSYRTYTDLTPLAGLAALQTDRKSVV